MNKITSEILHWLHANNIPADGVKVVIEFPTDDAGMRAKFAIDREIENLSIGYMRPLGEIETMNGIGVSLRTK